MLWAGSGSCRPPGTGDAQLLCKDQPAGMSLSCTRRQTCSVWGLRPLNTEAVLKHERAIAEVAVSLTGMGTALTGSECA